MHAGFAEHQARCLFVSSKRTSPILSATRTVLGQCFAAEILPLTFPDRFASHNPKIVLHI